MEVVRRFVIGRRGGPVGRDRAYILQQTAGMEPVPSGRDIIAVESESMVSLHDGQVSGINRRNLISGRAGVVFGLLDAPQRVVVREMPVMQRIFLRIVTDKDDNPVATGRAFLIPFEIKQMKKGMAVKVRSGSSDE